MEHTVDWSNIPVELWPLIGEKLKIWIEFLRFRSVCHSWRSCLLPFHRSIPPKFPFPFSDGPNAFVSENTVYLLRDPSTSSPSPSSTGLVKVEESDKLRLRNPITSRPIRCTNDLSFLEAFNLLDFNMMELSKSYVLRYILGSGSVGGLNKVIIVPPDFNDSAIIVICDKGKLSFAKNGDQKLTLISHGGFVCDDIIVYKGQPYVVDSLGSVFRIDSSLNLVELLSKLVGLGGRRKHLLESCGELYVVDRYFDQEPNKQGDSDLDFRLSFELFGLRGRHRRYESSDPKAVEFKVYKLELLDEEEGRWIEVKSLGDQAFFLAMDCSFSVSAQELAGCKENCIYFTDQNDINLALREVTRPETSVFNLEDHSIQRLGSSQIFWPLATELGTPAAADADLQTTLAIEQSS